MGSRSHRISTMFIVLYTVVNRSSRTDSSEIKTAVYGERMERGVDYIIYNMYYLVNCSCILVVGSGDGGVGAGGGGDSKFEHKITKYTYRIRH